MNISIEYNNYADSYYSGEEYGEWSVHNNFSISGICANSKHADLVTEFDVVDSGLYYLVYALYSEGDSFGYSDGIAHWIKLFETKDEAEKFVEMLNLYEEYKDFRHSGCSPMPPNKREKAAEEMLGYLLEFFDGIDETVDKDNSLMAYRRFVVYKDERLNFPWGGYFENLEEFVIKSVRTV